MAGPLKPPAAKPAQYNVIRRPGVAQPALARAAAPRFTAPPVYRPSNAVHGLARRPAPRPLSASPLIAAPHIQPHRPHAPVAQMMRRSARISGAGYVHSILGPSGGLLVSPPAIDKHGTRYWTGWRSDLRFYPATRNAVPGWGQWCPDGRLCGGYGLAISLDHVTDWATVQAGLATTNYCDGAYHWEGVLWNDAMNEYNDVTNLQWLCILCNSSKNGVRGLYSRPAYRGPCPGAMCNL